MHTRLLEIRVKSGKSSEIARNFNEKVLPLLKSQNGFVDAIVLRSDTDANQAVALSFWKTKDDADRYQREHYETISRTMEALLDGKPTLRTFEVAASTLHTIAATKAA
jgi:heme-degrading monooxygenase HmoA